MKDKDRQRAYMKAYRDNPANRTRKKEMERARYAANRPALLAKRRAWREKNIDTVRASRRQRHKERYNSDPAYREQLKDRQRKNREKNRLYLREYWLKKTYGITLAEYDALLAAQDGKCAICKTELNLNLDHCHDSGKLRGILCNRCNQGIGYFRNDIHLLKSAIAYLERVG